MRHMTEGELIAYQLRESRNEEAAGGDEAVGNEEAIRQHLETCAECAAVSDSIAETLRVFSAEQPPRADLDHAWQRLRENLPAPPAANPKRFRLAGWGWPIWPVLGSAMAALLVSILVGVHVHRGVERRHADFAFHRMGPLTEQPTDPAIANHLDNAERLLTEVNHASGPLDEGTRTQARDLLLKNAVYVHRARDEGDLAEASVLENLGRVLTTLNHDPPESDKGWHIRFEMNTDGLLLDIRILRQNDVRQ